VTAKLLRGWRGSARQSNFEHGEPSPVLLRTVCTILRLAIVACALGPCLPQGDGVNAGCWRKDATGPLTAAFFFHHSQLLPVDLDLSDAAAIADGNDWLALFLASRDSHHSFFPPLSPAHHDKKDARTLDQLPLRFLPSGVGGDNTYHDSALRSASRGDDRLVLCC